MSVTRLCRVVLDANVLVSAFQFGGIPLRLLSLLVVPAYQLFLSRQLIAEVERVLRSKFNASEELIGKLREFVAKYAVIVELDRIDPVCRDPDDDHVLACAKHARADLIVTGDKDLLALSVFERAAIIRPADAVVLLTPAAGMVS